MLAKRALILSSSSHRNVRRAALALAVAACPLFVHSAAHAANGSWTGAATPDNNWATPGNWDTVPGANNGTFVSPDIATFADSSNGTVVLNDTNRNVLGMTFNNT